MFAGGAALGRLVGYLVDITFGVQFIGVYAVVGAAALSSSVTHTLSSAIIVFELTGQNHYILPMLVAVVISFAMAATFSLSIYDVLLEVKGVPYLPALKSSKLYNYHAKDVMSRIFASIPEHATLKDFVSVIGNGEIEKVPILDEHGILLSDIHVDCLKAYIRSAYSAERDRLDAETRDRLDQYIE